MPRPPRERKVRKCERCSSLKESCSGTQPCGSCDAVGLSRQCMFRGGLKIMDRNGNQQKHNSSIKGKRKADENELESQLFEQLSGPLLSLDPDLVPHSSDMAQEMTSTIPFFRYFGNTAIAPGLRFVEVELRDDQTPVLLEHGDRHSASAATSTPSSTNENCNTIFDERNPTLPSQRILRHLVPLFFSHMSCHLPFLSESLTLAALEQETLEPLEANCICALASRFSELPELVAMRSEESGKYHSAEPFAAMAKELVLPMFSIPSLKVCQALLMITWIEWGSDRDAGAWLWSGLAIRMSQDIGLQYADTLQSAPDVETRRQYKLTFWAVYFIDRMISYGAGRTVAISQSSIEIDQPSEEECHLARKQINQQKKPICSHPWPYLLTLLQYRGDISDKLNQRSSQTFSNDITQGRISIMTFFHSLPPDLRFNVSNLQVLIKVQLAPLLVIMHCMFHSLVCILHRPSLLQKEQVAASASSEAASYYDKSLCSSSARTISDVLSFSLVLDDKTIIANPYMDHAIYIASLALLEDLEELALVSSQNGFSELTNQDRLWQRGSIIDKYEMTRECLEHLASHWGGIAWVCDWLDKRSRNLPDLKKHKESRAIYRAAPASVKLDMIKSLSKKHQSAQTLLQMSTTQGTNTLNPTNTNAIYNAEFDWSALQDALSFDNLVFDGVHDFFVPSGSRNDSSSFASF